MHVLFLQRNCRFVFDSKVMCESPQFCLGEQVDLVVGVYTSIAEDPYIASMHPVELMHVFSSCVVQRSMTRRRRAPYKVVAVQFLQRWVACNKRVLGKWLRPVPSSKRVLKPNLKRPNARGPSRQVTAHNIFVKRKIAQGRQRVAFCHLKYGHAEVLAAAHEALEENDGGRQGS